MDWLTFNLPTPDPRQAVALLGIDPAWFEKEKRQVHDRHWYGYSERLTSKYGNVFYHPQGSRRVLIELTGSACTEYRAMHGDDALHGLIAQIVADGGSITRLDLALDDYGGRVSPEVVRWHIQEKAYRSLLKHRVEVSNGLSTTYYWGGVNSEIRIRLYDKSAELSEKDCGTSRFRVEIQMRRKLATTAARMIQNIGTVGPVARNLLGKYLTFIVPTPEDTNRARWPIAPWWGGLLGDVEKIRVSAINRQTDLEQKARCLEAQWGPVMAVIWLQWGGDALNKIGKRSISRLKPEHLRMIDPERRPPARHLNSNDGDRPIGF